MIITGRYIMYSILVCMENANSRTVMRLSPDLLSMQYINWTINIDKIRNSPTMFDIDDLDHMVGVIDIANKNAAINEYDSFLKSKYDKVNIKKTVNDPIRLVR